MQLNKSWSTKYVQNATEMMLGIARAKIIHTKTKNKNKAKNRMRANPKASIAEACPSNCMQTSERSSM